MHIDSDVFDDYPEVGTQTKVDNYVGFTAELDGSVSGTPCAWFIEVMHMFQVFTRPMSEDPDEPWVLSEDHVDDESLGTGFSALVFFADMEELCNDWPVESIGTGFGPPITGFPTGEFDAPIISLEPNECCREVGEGGECVAGTATAEGYCES